MNGLTHPKYFPDISFINPILQPAIAGLMCGITSIFLPEVIGLGTGAIQSMILGNVVQNLLISSIKLVGRS